MLPHHKKIIIALIVLLAIEGVWFYMQSQSDKEQPQPVVTKEEQIEIALRSLGSPEGSSTLTADDQQKTINLLGSSKTK